MNENDKLFCLNAIDFHRALMIYVDYDKAENNLQAKDWEDCAHRGCMDCCMYREAQALADSNLVKKVAFLLSAAESTAWMVGSCAWDYI